MTKAHEANILAAIGKYLIYFPHYSTVDETEVNTFNNQSSSLIKLNNGTVLYLREVNKFLALVCILREENFQKQGKWVPRLVYFCIHYCDHNELMCITFTCCFPLRLSTGQA